MKKFLSKIMFAAVAILSVAGFTSCNNADDDPYVPTQTIEIHKQTESKTQEMTPAYGAVISESILNMFDVTVVLRSGDKSKEVALTKANGKADVTRSSYGNVTYYEYLFTEIDGQKGIGNAEVKVTPKADIKTILAGMPANEEINTMLGGRLFKAQFGTDGKLLGGVCNHAGVQFNSFRLERLLEDKGNGTFGYDIAAESLQDCM